MVQNFRKLRVWQDAQDLAVEVYELTVSFPSSERFGLSSRLRRGAISISSNIAEGCGRRGPGEMARSLEIAIGSCSELESQLTLVERLGYVDEMDLTAVLDAAVRIKRRTIRLLTRVEARRQPRICRCPHLPPTTYHPL
jgi:four helix bundle protein